MIHVLSMVSSLFKVVEVVVLANRSLISVTQDDPFFCGQRSEWWLFIVFFFFFLECPEGEDLCSYIPRARLGVSRAQCTLLERTCHQP